MNADVLCEMCGFPLNRRDEACPICREAMEDADEIVIHRPRKRAAAPRAEGAQNE